MSSKQIGDWLVRTKQADEISGAQFDEFCVGDWLHIEQLDKRQWYIGLHPGLQLYVTIGKDGTVSHVTTGTRTALDTEMPPKERKAKRGSKRQ